MDLPHHASGERDHIAMRTLTAVRPYLAAAFLLVISLVAYGCGDSATVNPEASLANLTVTVGTDDATLQPSFNPATTSYAVDLSNNVTTVTVSAQPAVAGDSVTIDGQATTSKLIDLGPPVPAGSTTLVSVTVSDPPNTPRTYTVLLRRSALEGNNSLQSLTVSPGTLNPVFAANTLLYTIDVANTVSSVTVTPALSDPSATMTVNGQATNSGQTRAVPLGPAGGTTDTNIVVTAQNGTQKTYTVRASRGTASNNNLQRLTVSPGTLNPTFNAARTIYTVGVTSTVASITVTPTRQDPTAIITLNGQAATSGQAQTIPLNGAGSNTLINIVMTAQNGTQKIYTVNVARAALGGNNNLSALTVSPGPLDDPFNANDQNYTVNVASTVTSITVTPTRQDPNATITVNGTPATSGQGRSVTLNGAGSNTLINIVVTAPNGSQKTYTVNVNRAALGGNNNLSALTVSPGPLAPTFTQNTLNYTVNVASTATSVNVSATKADPNAVMSGDVTAGAGIATGQATIPLDGPGTSRVVSIAVTAPNGSQKSYTITVERAALGGNNNLSALTVSPGPLTPAFTAATTSYTVDVASTVSSVSVTPREQDTAANTTVNGQATPSGQARTITLNGAGSNTLINIVVTAPNGTQKTYTVNVNRAALGGNNNLSGLTVSLGTLSPAFTTARTAYTVNAGSSDTSIIVTATPQDSSATVTINGQGGNSRSIPLPGGPSSTEIEVLVIAPNGTDKTHLITVNQPAPSAPPAPTSAPDLIAEDDSCARDSANACLPGTSDGDNITNVNTPRFRIPQPAAGEIPSLYVDEVKVAANFAQGANTLAPTAALSDGVHTITSTVTNAGGLESPQSPSLTVTIDTVAPVP